MHSDIDSCTLCSPVSRADSKSEDTKYFHIPIPKDHLKDVLIAWSYFTILHTICFQFVLTVLSLDTYIEQWGWNIMHHLHMWYKINASCLE